MIERYIRDECEKYAVQETASNNSLRTKEGNEMSQ